MKNLEVCGLRYAGCAGMLLYPTVGEELDHCDTVQGHPVYVRTVDLGQAWPAIHERLLQIVLNVDSVITE